MISGNEISWFSPGMTCISTDPVPENASSGNERNLAKSKLIGAGDFA
jgi:hypothetical protein